MIQRRYFFVNPVLASERSGIFRDGVEFEPQTYSIRRGLSTPPCPNRHQKSMMAFRCDAKY